MSPAVSFAERHPVIRKVVMDTAAGLDAPSRFALDGRPFLVVTLHRPANVDSPAALAELLGALGDVALRMPVVFPMHPRTRERVHRFGLVSYLTGIRVVDPLGYLELVGLVDRSAVVLTDSGGLQVEMTILGVPCLTVRTATEWSETVSQGTNWLVSPDRGEILNAIEEIVQRRIARAPGTRPEGWDGTAGRRVLEALEE